MLLLELITVQFYLTMTSTKKDVYQSPPLSMPIEDRVKALITTIGHDPDYNGFDTPLVKQVTLTSVTPGTTVWEMTITPSMCNKCVALLHFLPSPMLTRVFTEARTCMEELLVRY